MSNEENELTRTLQTELEIEQAMTSNNADSIIGLWQKSDPIHRRELANRLELLTNPQTAQTVLTTLTEDYARNPTQEAIIGIEKLGARVPDVEMDTADALLELAGNEEDPNRSAIIAALNHKGRNLSRPDAHGLGEKRSQKMTEVAHQLLTIAQGEEPDHIKIKAIENIYQFAHDPSLAPVIESTLRTVMQSSINPLKRIAVNQLSEIVPRGDDQIIGHLIATYEQSDIAALPFAEKMRLARQLTTVGDRRCQVLLNKLKADPDPNVRGFVSLHTEPAIQDTR